LLKGLLKRNKDIAWRTIEGTTFLVSPFTKKIYPLNEAGQVIWDSLEKETDPACLAKILCRKFQVDLETAKDDTREFCEQLLEEGLIEAVG